LQSDPRDILKHMPKPQAPNKSNAATTVGYKAQLWQMTDAFEEHHKLVIADKHKGADPEDSDEYRTLRIFWVPPEARLEHLKPQARQPTVGKLLNDAMAGVGRCNSALKSFLPKEYARPVLYKSRLGQLIDVISNMKVGDEKARAEYVLGRV
jgi:type I restriction enzyme M protein